MTIAILSLGTEIIRGELVNTNAQWLAEALSDDGFEVSEMVSVGDDLTQIRDSLERLASHNQAIVCTGGLGPTTDDVTTEAVAALVSRPLELDQPSLERIRERFRRFGRPLAPSNEKQALFPQGSRVLENLEGTAPGFAIAIGQAQAFFMPGVPREMRAMFERHVRQALPRPEGSYLHQVRLNTFGLPESNVNDQLAGIAAEHGVLLGYRAHFPEIQVKVLARGTTLAKARERAEAGAAAVHARLGNTVVFSRGIHSLPEVVGQLVEEHGLMFGLAESCTGGLVAELLTAHAGASNYFAGGVVCYSNQVKQQVLGVPRELLEIHGAVSQPVAEAMARGACRALGVPLALALTGVAGPAGGSDEKPVGTVHIAVASGTELVHDKSFFPGTRRQIQLRAAYKGLGMVRDIIGAGSAQ